MLTASDFGRLQQEQYRHDQRNHFDILCLPKSDRLKHYGLHFAKYAGRLARGIGEPISATRTVVDTLLVCLSAANTLHQDLRVIAGASSQTSANDEMLRLTDAAGRFCDACEKIDHLEQFLPLALSANADIAQWTLNAAADRNIDLDEKINERRSGLALRHFYIVS